MVKRIRERSVETRGNFERLAGGRKEKDGRRVFGKKLHRPGIGPGPPPWQGEILPLDQRCSRLGGAPVCTQCQSKLDLEERQALLRDWDAGRNPTGGPGGRANVSLRVANMLRFLDAI